MNFLSAPFVPVHVPLLYNVKEEYFYKYKDESEKCMQARQWWKHRKFSLVRKCLPYLLKFSREFYFRLFFSFTFEASPKVN